MANLTEAFNTFTIKVVDKEYPEGICDCGQDLNTQRSYKICDNGCGTTYCSSCNKKYNVVNNVWVKGHSKTCGRIFPK